MSQWHLVIEGDDAHGVEVEGDAKTEAAAQAAVDGLKKAGLNVTRAHFSGGGVLGGSENLLKVAAQDAS